MPTSPTPNMGLVMPTLNDDVGEWDDYLNELLETKIDPHDHTTGKGVKVPTAGLDIDEDLSFAGQKALNLGGAQLTAVAAATMAGINRAFWVSSADNELYFRNNSGTDIKFTTGGTLNISLSGGIGGDYSAAGALLSFDDATDRYLAQQQGAPRPWAGFATGNLDIYEQAASIVNRVRLKSPAALAASYDLTFPAALPGSTSVLQLSAAGVITASNTIANAVVLGSTLSVGSTLDVTGVATFPGGIGGTPNFTGAVTMASTLGVTGLITATAGMTANEDVNLAADKTINLVDDGKVNHGDKHMSFSPAGGVFLAGAGAGSGTQAVSGNQITFNLSTAGDFYFLPLNGLKPGDRIKSVRVAWTSTAGAPTMILIHNTYTTPLQLAMTIGATEVSFGVNLTEYTVDSPTALSNYNALPGAHADTFWARRATLKFEAGTNDTTIYAVDITYDSVDEVYSA